MCSKDQEFKSILFSLCYFHACVAGRLRFGPQGWSRSYPFSSGDLTICANILYNYLEASPKVSAVLGQPFLGVAGSVGRCVLSERNRISVLKLLLKQPTLHRHFLPSVKINQIKGFYKIGQASSTSIVYAKENVLHYVNKNSVYMCMYARFIRQVMKHLHRCNYMQQF